MSISERLRFILEADVSDAVRGFEQVGKAADEKLAGAESRVDKLGAGMIRAGAAMLAAGGLAAAGLVKAAQASGDLETELYKVDRIFGESAGTVREFAEGAADTMGMSTRAAAAMAVELGRIGQKAGVAEGDLAGFSAEWATIVGDAAAFSGADPSEVIGAIGAATRGEYDSLERFGGTLTAAKVEAYALANGLATSKDEMTDAARVTAALALIQEDLSFATGTLAERNADGALEAQKLSAQWENLQAQLGEQALPILRDVLGGVGGLLGGVNDLNDATGGLVGTVATWGTGLLLAGGAVSTVVGKVIELRGSLKMLTDKFGTANVAAGAFGTALAGVFTYALVTRMGQVNDRLAKFAAAADAIVSGGADVEDTLAGLVREEAKFEQLVRMTGISLEELGRMVMDTSSNSDTFADSLGDMADAAGASDAEMLRIMNTAGELWSKFSDARQAAETLAGAVDRTGNAASNATGPVGELANASIRARDRLLEVGSAADGATDQVAEMQAAWERLIGALDQREATVNAKEQIEEAFLAMYLGADDAEQQVKEAMVALQVLASTAEGFANQKLVTEIAVLVEQGQLDEALRKARNLQALLNVINGTSSPGTNLTPPPMGPDLSWINDMDWSFLDGTRAAGGPVSAGGTYVVGERGPELLAMGASSGFVTPNHALGGSNYSITVNAGMGADGALIGQQIVEEIRRFERRNGAGWRS